MAAIMFQEGGQLFRMLVTPDDGDPHDKSRLTIDSLEVCVSGAFIDISGLIDIVGEDLKKLRQVDYAIARFCCGRPVERSGMSDSDRERFLFARTEARAINGGAF